MTQVRIVRGRPLGALLVIAALAAACTGSGASTTAAPPTAIAVAPSVAATADASASPSETSSTGASEAPSETPQVTAVPTSIDPCQLISSDEASKLAGVNFGAGKASTTSGNTKICTYGASTPNVFQVMVAIAPDAATAKADEAKAKADIEAEAKRLAGHGVKITELPDFAPDTDAVLLDATVNVNGHTVGGRALYLVRGTTFFGFSDLALDQAPPTANAVKAEAKAVLGRLP